MDIKAAIKFLSSKIKQEGTRSDTGVVLVRTRADLKSKDFVPTPEWLSTFDDELYRATTEGTDYGDYDWTSEIKETLQEYLVITDEQMEELY